MTKTAAKQIKSPIRCLSIVRLITLATRGAHGHEPPTTFIDALHAEVRSFADGQTQPDDPTAVVVKGCSAPS